MEIEKIVRHTIKKEDNLKRFENADTPVIFTIKEKEYLLNGVNPSEIVVLYRDSKNDDFPTTAALPLRNYLVRSLTLKSHVEFADFSMGQNIRLNEAGFVYQGKNARLKNGERLHREGILIED